MRGTMFITPHRLAPALHSTTAKDAHRNRGNAVEYLRSTLGWSPARYAAVEKATLAALASRGRATAAELPDLREHYAVNPGKSYETRQRVTAPILGTLAVEGRIRRTRPAGSWTSAQFRREPAEPFPTLPVAEARAVLARHYLAAFGPVTAADMKWWTGWTLTDTRKAIAATGAEAVELDEGTGYLLPEDNQHPAEVEPEPWVALLPGLDPTSMGWRHRDFYLDTAHTAALFDRNGNVGPTVWADGRIVGAWAQRPDGRIAHRLLTDPGRHTRALINNAVQRLAVFLDCTPRHPVLPHPPRTRTRDHGCSRRPTRLRIHGLSEQGPVSEVPPPPCGAVQLGPDGRGGAVDRWARPRAGHPTALDRPLALQLRREPQVTRCAFADRIADDGRPSRTIPLAPLTCHRVRDCFSSPPRPYRGRYSPDQPRSS